MDSHNIYKKWDRGVKYPKNKSKFKFSDNQKKKQSKFLRCGGIILNHDHTKILLVLNNYLRKENIYKWGCPKRFETK